MAIETGIAGAIAAVASLAAIIVAKGFKTPEEKRASERLKSEREAQAFLKKARELLDTSAYNAVKMNLILKEINKDAEERRTKKPDNGTTTPKPH